jgi:hypothetical protein
MLNLEECQVNQNDEKSDDTQSLRNMEASIAEVSKLIPAIAAWKRADRLALPVLCKNWEERANHEAHECLRKMSSLLEASVPAAIERLALMLKNLSHCCCTDSGLRAWVSCLVEWLDLRNAVQVCVHLWTQACAHYVVAAYLFV